MHDGAAPQVIDLVNARRLGPINAEGYVLLITKIRSLFQDVFRAVPNRRKTQKLLI